MPGYIDVDALIKLMNEKHKHLVDESGWYDHYTSGYEDAITDVEEAPTVDVAPVVRCKECKHRGTDICPMRLNELSWYEGKHGVRGTYMQTKDETCSDGFCHKGER